MNSTIVFVMIFYTTQANYIPTLEFNSLEKCLAASEKIQAAVNKEILMGKMRPPLCVKIEK